VTDIELVAGLQRQDPEAYRELVLRFGSPLHGYIYRLTQDSHLTDDILIVVRLANSPDRNLKWGVGVMYVVVATK